MELRNFLKVLVKQKFILLIVPLIAAIITILLVRKMQNTYKSTSRIATGLVQRSDLYVNRDNNQESKINQEFSNIIQMMMLKKVINQVTYQLIIHDLSNPAAPYREPSKLVKNLNEGQRRGALNVFTEKYNKQEELSLWDKNQNSLQKLLESMDYDYKSLTKVLNIYRLENSDYILMEFKSENPSLSASTLNLLAKNFIDYYTTISNRNKNKSVNFLDSLLKAKEALLNLKMAELKNYKIKNKVLDVSQQANVLMSQIADFESRKQEASKNIYAYSGAINNIDSKFDPKDRKYLESTVTQSNQNISATRNRLTAINEEYIKSNFAPRYKKTIDSLQNSITDLIDQSNDRVSTNPLAAKQDLVKQKLELETNLELAKNSVSSLDNEVKKLTGQLNMLAPNQATIQAFEKDIEVESKEYLELTQKLNEANMEASFPVQLTQVEMAMPGQPEPSKKLLLIFLSAVVSFVFCVVILFILFYLDKSVSDPNTLANKTEQPVVGVLNFINNKGRLERDLIWNDKNETSELKELKNSIRTIRFEIENELNGLKTLGVTSLKPYDGKTFFSLNLALGYQMINKRVLLIDGNFDTPDITSTIRPDIFLEDYLVGKSELEYDESTLNDRMYIMGNKGKDISLLEITNTKNIQTRLKELENYFDLIIIEIPSFKQLNNAREWISFCDKIISVFESGQNLDEMNKKEIDYLKKLNGKMIGWIMNKMKSTGPKQPLYLPASKVTHQLPEKSISL